MTDPSSDDRGDDLLDRKVELPEVGEFTQGKGGTESIDEAIESAKILESEGMLDEAKKLLRGILVRDRDHLEARRRLHSIHDEELKQIFQTESKGYQPPNQRESTEFDPTLVDIDELVRKLDLVVDLDESPVPLPVEDRVEIQQLGTKLSSDDELNARDRLDLAVAFSEMELFSVAEEILQAELSPLRENRGLDEEAKELYLSAVLLCAYAQLQGQRAHRAVVTLEPLVQDGTLEGSQLVEVVYLMARAYERQGKLAIAERWYERAIKIEENHRDTQERLKRLRKRRKEKGGGLAL